MSAFDNIVSTQARPLPVIVLADVSGSMNENGKLDSLKHALVDMVKSFKDASSSSLEADIYVSVITFGAGHADIALEPKSASEIADSSDLQIFIDSMNARGNTPLGAALTKLNDMLEHRESYPSRAYRPFLVLASDGMPNDQWRDPLQQLLTSERGKKATRLALAIGTDADEGMLEQFVNNVEIPVFKANNVSGIKKFFKCVTMSAIKSSQSANPGVVSTGDVAKILMSEDEIFGD